jgi:hypothetical protein
LISTLSLAVSVVAATASNINSAHNVVSNALSNEISNRISADNVLSNLISNKASAVSSLVSVLSLAVSAAAATASNANSALSANLTSAANVLSNLISNKTSAVSALISTLSLAVSAMGATASNLVSATNIKTDTWILPNPIVGGTPGRRIPRAGKVLSVNAYTTSAATTVTLNIETRTAVNAAGANLMSADVAVSNTDCPGTMNAVSILSAGNWLWVDISAVSGGPSMCVVTLTSTTP